jgi:hypothetical protein
MSNSNGQSPKVADGVLRIPGSAAEVFASRNKTISAGQGNQSLNRIARFRDTCKCQKS